MDKIYLENLIKRIEEERSVHDKKFEGKTVHKDCLPRFDQTIARLYEELAKIEAKAC
jgi:hypothetical protein